VTDRSLRILLVGMMGTGKSSVGRALQARTGWRFVDNDALVEQVTGMTARELVAERGAEAMRSAEAAALGAGLVVPPPAVVATAAGTILDPRHREAIRTGGFVVWLRAPASVLAVRAVGAEHRPWLDDDPAGWFKRTIVEREPLYASVADLRIDTGVTGPDQAAETILRAATIGP
jgi:shikimate kinase